MKVFTRHRNYREIIEWLEKNAGPSVIRPENYGNFSWVGRGWSMRRTFGIKNIHDGGWYIEIEDQQLATWCALRWT